MQMRINNETHSLDVNTMHDEEELNNNTQELLTSLADNSTMVNYMMSGVKRYCGNCMKSGEFLQLKFVMMNIDSGLWMCPKKECIFPMASESLKDYIEDNLTAEKVLLLTGKKCVTDDKVFEPSSGSKVSLSNVNIGNSQVSNNLSTSTTNSRGVSDKDSMKTASVISKEDAVSIITDSMSNSSVLSEILSNGSKKNMTEFYPLWENEELLCWLDVMLGIFVFNTTLKMLCATEDPDNLVSRFYEHHRAETIRFRSSGSYSSIKENMDNFRSAVRQFLQPKMLSNFSEEDSPLLAIELLTKTNKKAYKYMEIEYQSEFKCNKCDFQRQDGFCKMILTLPNTPDDLNLSNNVYYTRPCYRCGEEGQQSKYTVEKYPDSLFVYFEQGLNRRGKFWKRMEFVAETPTSSPEKYIVTEIVQYINKRRHFVLWAYSYKEKLWIEADDFKDPVVTGRYKYPKCKPQEVHLMVWEKVSVLEADCAKRILKEEAADSSSQNTTDSFASTPVDSPAYSGSNGSLLRGPNSGVSSRAASLTSADGISPTITPTGSVVDIPTGANASSTSGDQMPLQGSLKGRYLHIPRYKPYIPRGKQTVASASSSLSRNNNDTSSNNTSPLVSFPATAAVDPLSTTQTAQLQSKNSNNIQLQEHHTNRPAELDILDQLKQLPIFDERITTTPEHQGGSGTTFLLNELNDVIGEELDEFYLEMLEQKALLEETSSAKTHDVESTTDSRMNTQQQNLTLVNTLMDIDTAAAASASSTPNKQAVNTFEDIVDFSVDGSVPGMKISEDELDEIING